MAVLGLVALAVLSVQVYQGGDDEQSTKGLGLPHLWNMERTDQDPGGLVRPQILLGMRSQEALNGTPDSILRGLGSGPDIGVAAERLVVEKDNDDQGDDAGGSSYDPGAAEEETHGEAPPEGGLGELWKARTYRCEGDGTGAYCYPDLTASGVPVQAGVAACEPGRMGGVYEAGGRVWTCADTGLFSGYDVLEIWCHSIDHWGYPGTAEYPASPEYAEPCPNLCEQVIEGYCYAEVRRVR